MKHRIVAIGEILWDLLPTGPQLGGAPTNFALHCHALGADVWLITSVDFDKLGIEATHCLAQRGMHAYTMWGPEGYPTGTVEVTIGSDGQPAYRIVENVAWDQIVASDADMAAVAVADAVCFGSLAQRSPRSRKTIRKVLDAARPDSFRVFDVNLRVPYFDAEVIETSLDLANALKLNDQELPILATMFGLPAGAREGIAALIERFGLTLVALTRGAAGSLLYADGEWNDHPGLPTKVVDTVGAGDAFTAMLTVGRLSGWPLAEINLRANELAAFVCSQAGATPELPESLVG